MPDTEFPAFRSASSPFPGQRLRKPLVDYITNEWRNEPPTSVTYANARNSRSDDFLDRLEVFIERLLAVIRAPKFRRLLLLVIVLLLSTFFLWTRILEPFVTQERAVWKSLSVDAAASGIGVFGTNTRPHFPNMIHLQDLDPSLLPRSSKNQHNVKSEKKRLVFVGDIHGCRAELEDLLKEVHFDPATDHLIATGDIVMKGPDTSGVIDLLRGYKASCVRGNHEDRLLLVADDLESTSLRSSKGADNGDQAESFKADSPERKLAKSLNADQLAYLRACPVILRVGELKAFGGEAVVVHAGLVPGVPLQDQDPASVMNMRIVDLNTHVPSKNHEKEGSIPWNSMWNKHQQLAPAQRHLAQLRDKGKWDSSLKHTTVIYGHNAKKGLQIKKYTKGLDSDCVRGGKLTALVVGDDGKQTIVQVNCRDQAQSLSVETGAGSEGTSNEVLD